MNAEATSSASHQSQKEKEATKRKKKSKLVQSPEEKQSHGGGWATMDALGLRYIYANLDLTQVVQAYLRKRELNNTALPFLIRLDDRPNICHEWYPASMTWLNL